MDTILNLVGLSLRAGRLAVGEEPAAAAVRAKEARLLLVADDAAENTQRRAKRFRDLGNCVLFRIPFTKAELGAAVGRSSCAIVALLDIGFAAAVGEKLAARDGQYAEGAETICNQRKRQEQRRAEKRAHERKQKAGQDAAKRFVYQSGAKGRIQKKKK